MGLALALFLVAGSVLLAKPTGRTQRRPAPPPLAPAGPSNDPRVALHVMWEAGDRVALLAQVEAALAENPAQARAWGYDYLRGRLLAELGRTDEAAAALTAALASAPGLTPWTRYHLARLHESIGRPAMAAALASAVLGEQPVRPLLVDSLNLLERAIAAGGDCRIIAKLPPLSWKPEDLRVIALIRAECAWREDRKTQALAELTTLLRQKVGDDAALLAAGRLAARQPLEQTDGRTALLMGAAFYEHRDFPNALKFLGRALAERAGGYEAQFSIGRSQFWLEDHAAAAASFGLLAESSTGPGERAQAFYHQGRALELVALSPHLDAPSRLDALDRAGRAFAQVVEAAPEGRLAGAGAVSLVRLDYLRGREDAAKARVAALLAKRNNESASQTLMFLIASELSRGRTQGVAGWLATATKLGQARKVELQYWQAKLDELQGSLPAAAEGYLRLAMTGPYDPVADRARYNLRQPALAPIAERRARQLAGSSLRADELAFAWRFLGDDDEDGRRAYNRLGALLVEDPRAAPFLRLQPKAPADWLLWRLPLGPGLDQLATLGLWDDVGSSWSRYFPWGDSNQSLAGSRAFDAAGAWHRGISLGENLGKRAPAEVAPLLPRTLRQALYPLGPAVLVDGASSRFQIDRTLLAAIVREESRFNPNALSGASARGLTQFILPTAQKIARGLGLGELAAQDLHRPEISIPLGAAYLAELSQTFGRRETPMVAAYNAGAPQAALWQSYCYSDDPVEYLSKVGFKETRDYLTKVLTSRAHYREIYPAPTAAPAVHGESATSGR